MRRPASFVQTPIVVAAAALLVGVGVASSARAETSEPVRVQVEATADCATDMAFFDAVRGRTPRVRLARPAEAPAHTLRVKFEKTHHLTTGELVLIDAKGGVTHRQLAGDTCEAVVSGLAWVAARAIDPDASFAPSVIPVAPVPVALPAPAPASAPPPLRTQAREPSPPAPLRPVSARTTSTPRVDTPSAPWRLRVGADVGTFDFRVPAFVPDVAAFADVALDSPTALAPAFRLAFHHTPEMEKSNTPSSSSQTSAEFTWTYVRADGCPWRLAPVRTLAFRPCAFLDGGVLAAGGGSPGTGSHVKPWFAAGALGRVDWTLLDPIALEVEGGALFPFIRDDFDSPAGVTLYQVNPAVPFASIGFAGRFP